MSRKYHKKVTAGFAKREGYVVIKLVACSLFSCTLDEYDYVQLLRTKAYSNVEHCVT